MNYPSRELVKKQARIMLDYINCEGFTLSAAYHCISKMWGFENWNQFAAYFKLNEKEL